MKRTVTNLLKQYRGALHSISRDGNWRMEQQ